MSNPRDLPLQTARMLEEVRNEFEVLFPKDQEAVEGIRPSKSNRSSALMLWARLMMVIDKMRVEYEAKIRDIRLEHHIKADLPPEKTRCVVKGCGELSHGRGLCQKHYTTAYLAVKNGLVLWEDLERLGTALPHGVPRVV